MSGAQAAHSHGDVLPAGWSASAAGHVAGAANKVHPDDGAESCPLCVAMHSTLPARAGQAAPQMAGRGCAEEVVFGRVPERHWAYALFGRPPPRA